MQIALNIRASAMLRTVVAVLLALLCPIVEMRHPASLNLLHSHIALLFSLQLFPVSLAPQTSSLPLCEFRTSLPKTPTIEMAYAELDTNQNLIRLLRLGPASSDDDEITCSFVIASLDEKPEFEALSYTWGDVNDTRPVEVEGSALPVTSNLHSALRHLRLKDKERTLWVDALCINQADFKEKMHQVSRMSSIYGQASQVVVQLSEG